MLIFGTATGVPALKALCNSDCLGSCSYSGFDLNCDCQVALNETNFECGDIAYCENASNQPQNMTTIGRKCDCQTNYYNQSLISCNIAACPEGYSGNSTSTTCTDIYECLNGICGSNALCLNTPGSYVCSCDEGYTLVNDHICTKSVLVLSTAFGMERQPMLISYNGKINFLKN